MRSLSIPSKPKASRLLTSFINLFYFVEQGLRRKEVFFALAGPDVFITDRPILVDNKIRADGVQSIFAEYPVGPHELVDDSYVTTAAEEGIRDLEEIGKCLLWKHRSCRDT